MRNGRESKRYSSKVDLERITKRTTRTKQPLVLIFMGQSGLGISTLVDMLLLEYENKEVRHFSVDANAEEKELVSAEERKAQREGGGLGYREVTAETPSGLKLVVLDFQGLDDPNTRVIAPIVEMIKKRFAGYLETNDIEFMVRANLSKGDRKKTDSRIHGCFYFVAPGATTNGDIKNMRVLADVVNLIPIIARADTLTPGELVITKSALADDLDANEVICYGNVIPAAVPGDPESLKMVEVFAQLAEKMPFAIISSVDTVEIQGKLVFGRQYSWGTVDATNESSSDYYSLQLFVQNNADDLRQRTSDVVYEDYRKTRVAALKILPTSQAS